LRSLSYAFFVPIFFVSIGLNVNLQQLGWDSAWVFAIISVIAILGKIIGAGSGALIAKFSPREALQLGIGMVSRGEVGLIIANIGVTTGYLSEEMLTIIVGMILVTTLVTPPMLRWSFKKPDSGKTEIEPMPLNSSKETL